MKKDSISDMKVYQNAKKVSKNLGISNSNLRRYSQILEANGYQFTKEEGKINYLEKDIIVLKKLIELVNIDGISLDDAAKDIMSMFDDNGEVMDKSTEVIAPTQEEGSTEDLEIDTMEKKLDKAIEFIMEEKRMEAEFKKVIQEKDELIARLKAENEQHKKDKQIINLRDKLLLETIRRKQEEQKNAAATIGFWPKKNNKRIK